MWPAATVRPVNGVRPEVGTPGRDGGGECPSARSTVTTSQPEAMRPEAKKGRQSWKVNDSVTPLRCRPRRQRLPAELRFSRWPRRFACTGTFRCEPAWRR